MQPKINKSIEALLILWHRMLITFGRINIQVHLPLRRGWADMEVLVYVANYYTNICSKKCTDFKKEL